MANDQRNGELCAYNIATKLRYNDIIYHRLLPFFTLTESKRRGVLLEVKRKKTELGRNSFSYSGIVVWNSLDRRTRNLEKLDALKVALNHNKTSLNKITFNKGVTVNLNKDINFLYY